MSKTGVWFLLFNIIVRAYTGRVCGFCSSLRARSLCEPAERSPRALGAARLSEWDARWWVHASLITGLFTHFLTGVGIIFPFLCFIMCLKLVSFSIQCFVWLSGIKGSHRGCSLLFPAVRPTHNWSITAMMRSNQWCSPPFFTLHWSKMKLGVPL